ncbi:MAG TPA: hypothetical protein PLG27_09950 [Candidatus Latescibacteria bacterium]|nr:hypothetical protein [Candidatus Latescibacterota bacterium]
MPRRQMDIPITHVHHGAYTLEGDIEPIIAELRPAPPVLYQCSSTATPLPNTAGAAIATPTDRQVLFPSRNPGAPQSSPKMGK